MKIRQGFVSNSSTTSFCIYGVALEGNDPAREDKDLIKKVKDANLVHYDDMDGGSFYIGRCYDTIGDEETGQQFKQSTEEKIAAIIGRKEYCCTYQEEIPC
jgi:hypothetical protein